MEGDSFNAKAGFVPGGPDLGLGATQGEETAVGVGLAGLSRMLSAKRRDLDSPHLKCTDKRCRYDVVDRFDAKAGTNGR